MEEGQKSSQLSPQATDYVTAAARAVLGMVPFAGSLLAELAGTIIPNQRIDRIAKFAKTLERKLLYLEQDFVRSQLVNESFTDLLEEGMRQAACSLSDERREYIANVVANSLSSEDIEYEESKHLLRILGEISDIEIVWLKFYLNPTERGDEAFRNKHANILEPVVATMASPPEVHEKGALQKSYKEHLVQLGLLQYHYSTDSKTRVPEVDRFTGALKILGYEISPLGRLLLKYIGLVDEPERRANQRF
jgi:hypothetical protein